MTTHQPKIEKLVAELCPNGVEFKELKDICLSINAGGDLPKNYTKGLIEPTDKYPYPIYSNGTEDKALYGYTDGYKIDSEAVTISARGTIGYHTVRAAKFTPIVRLIILIPNVDLITSKFLNYALDVTEIGHSGGSIPQLTVPNVKKIKIPLPPLAVQQEIVKILDTFTELEAELETELEAELGARKKQYEHYREGLLSIDKDMLSIDLNEIANYSKTRIAANELNVDCYVGVDNLLQNRQGKTISNYVPKTGKLTRYEVGDILVGNIRPYLKKIWQATNVGGANGDVLVIRVNEIDKMKISSRFLYHLLASDEFFNYNMQNAKGAKMPRGNKSAILKFKIPIPSLAEQARIVAILDKFDALVNDISIGLPAELKARRQQYEHYRDEMLSFGDEVKLVSLGDLGVFNYGFTDKAKNHGNVRFVRITDINENGKLRPNDSKFLDLTDSNKEFILEKGDILMARTGATYGKTVLFNEEYSAIYASFLIRIRFNVGNVIPAYYWHFAQSGLFWDQAKKLVGGGAQPQFNGNVLKKIQIPLPQLAEQARIVAILDKFDALVNDISIGLSAELKARRQQYEYYREKLLTFKEN